MNTVPNPDRHLSQPPIDPTQVLSPWVDYDDFGMTCSKRTGSQGYIVTKICPSSIVQDGGKRITICGMVSKMYGAMEKVRAHVDKILRRKGYSLLAERVAERVYVFHGWHDIEKLADSYIVRDSKTQMQMKNGMTRKIFINALLLNQFMNENDFNIGSPLINLDKDRLMEIAGICGQYYRIPPEHLADAWIKVMGMEYYDPERQREILRRLKELRISE